MVRHKEIRQQFVSLLPWGVLTVPYAFCYCATRPRYIEANCKKRLQKAELAAFQLLKIATVNPGAFDTGILDDREWNSIH